MTMSSGERAVNLHYSIIQDEDERLREGLTYSDEKVRMAIVHARQDLIGITSRVSDACDAAIGCEKYLKFISWMLGAIMVLLSIILWFLVI